MRIVGGTHRGRLLKRVDKVTTRETADMVKVAVFNMLGSQLTGRVLDLFAGSGSYGFESLSRGAFEAYFVDVDKDAVKTIKDNAHVLGFLGQSMIYNQDYMQFMDGLNHSILFDYVFLDPPYEKKIYMDVIKKLKPNLTENAYVICESEKKLILPDEIEGIIKIKDKTYGIKRISIYKVV
jgi:16S rRNA (guanine(966)-N(2))-methyltransferase RsmD